MRWIALAALTATPALSQESPKTAPVNLTCYLVQPSGTRTMMDVTADEASGSVTTFVRSTGLRKRYAAVFRPGDVLFADSLASYRIDRVDLSFALTLKDIDSGRNGKCELAKVPDRAF